MHNDIPENQKYTPSFRRSSIFLYFLFLITVFSLIILFTRASLTSLFKNMSQISIFAILGAILALFGYFFLRGIRWWIILYHLNQKTRKKTIIQSYFAQQITNFSSTLFLGGPLRVFLIHKLEKVPPSIGIISISREIVTDLAGLLVLLIVCLSIDLIVPYGLSDFILTTIKDFSTELSHNNLYIQIFVVILIFFIFLILIIQFSKRLALYKYFERISFKIKKFWDVLNDYTIRSAFLELTLTIIMYFSLILHYSILFMGIKSPDFKIFIAVAILSAYIFFVTVIPVRIGFADITLVGIAIWLGVSSESAVIVSLVSRGIISTYALIAVPLATKMISDSVKKASGSGTSYE